LLACNTSTPVDRLLDQLLAELDQFSAGTQMSDDVTVLTLRYVGGRMARSEPVYAGADTDAPRAFSTSQSRAVR
jgi:hypothetical protein